MKELEAAWLVEVVGETAPQPREKQDPQISCQNVASHTFFRPLPAMEFDKSFIHTLLFHTNNI